MKKLFISQPMKGKTDEEIQKEREKAIAAAKEALGEDVEVIDSFFKDFPENPTGNVPLQYLSKSIALLAEANIAYFAPGYENARGCIIEFNCADSYGIPWITYEGKKRCDL